MNGSKAVGNGNPCSSAGRSGSRSDWKGGDMPLHLAPNFSKQGEHRARPAATVQAHDIGARILQPLARLCRRPPFTHCLLQVNLSLIHISEPTRRTPISYAV